MIKMVCAIEGERTITMDSCGISKIKNGDIISIKNEDLIQPEIQFLMRKEILTVVEETESEFTPEEKNYLRPSVVVYECYVPDGRKLTLDSIKGTVETGKRIEIKAADINNEDVAYAIRKEYIRPVDPPSMPAPNVLLSEKPAEAVVMQTREEAKKALKEKVIEEKAPEEIMPMLAGFANAVEEDEAPQEIEDVAIEDIVETEAIEEAPKFRVGENVENDLKNLASNIIAENEPVVPKTKAAAKPGTRKKRKSKKA